MNKADRVEELWYSQNLPTYSYNTLWLRQTVPLNLQDINGTFTLIFRATYNDGCQNSVGIDHITFDPCPEGKNFSGFDTLIISL